MFNLFDVDFDSATEDLESSKKLQREDSKPSMEWNRERQWIETNFRLHKSI